MSKKPPVYIVGPTASGKSELALLVAKKFDGVIISADSMQIYRGLDIGTAKVSKEVQAQAEHKLIDIVDFDEEFSVAQYREAAKNEISAAQEMGKLPVVAGGTGLYFESLLYPMSFANTDKHSTLRDELQREYEAYGAEKLHDKLKSLDEEAAKRLHPNDVKRVIRALEIVLTSGKPMRCAGDRKEEPSDVIMVGLETDRQKLYDRINARVDKMFEQGLAEEALSLAKFDCQSMQAIGYKEFKACRYDIDGEGKIRISKEEADRIKNDIKQHTRNYAKRQLTWFRRYKFAKWFECGDYDEALNYIHNMLQIQNDK